MHKLVIWIVSLTFLSSCFAATPDPFEQMVKEKITTLMEKNNIPGVAVELVANGEPHAYFFGYANRERKLPVTKYTIFELGSISKVMTSIIFAQQVDYAKMQLDTPLSTYFENAPEKLSKITLQDLATHTSGLPFVAPNLIKDRNQLITYFTQWEPEKNVKEAWAYSNFGIGLLGYTIESITHRDFNQLYRSRILNPLGMQNIGLIVPKKLQPFYAQGYDKENKPAQKVELDFFASASGLKSSASDMQRFLNAAIGLPGTPPRILYPMRITQSAYIKLADKMQGLGWEIHTLKNPEAYQHLLLTSEAMNLGPIPVQEVLERPIYDGNALIDKTGATKGFRVYIGVIPNKKAGIVLMMNKHVDNKVLVHTAREILFNIANATKKVES